MRIYARCGKHIGELILFGSNLSPQPSSLRLGAPLSAATSREDFLLTGELGGKAIMLNGEEMVVDEHGGVPPLSGVASSAAAPLTLPARSSFFMMLRGVGAHTTNRFVCSVK